MTTIEWVKNKDGSQGKSWNPVTGCTKISPGCKHCYAERMARRLAGRYGYPEAPKHFNVTLHLDRLDEPLKRKKPTTFFVCSMGDLFHESVHFGDTATIFDIMARTPQHTYQVLTKRPQNALRFFDWYKYPVTRYKWPFSNVWSGVTVENQATADERRADFEAISAAVKFVSFEPALGPIDWAGWEFVDQIISGGESGPGARPSHPDWHRAALDFCQENDIAYFFKQWGAWKPIGDFDPQTGVYHYSWQHAEPYRRVASVGLDGNVYGNDYPPAHGWHMARVTKKRAGHLLDGQAWREFPHV